METRQFHENGYCIVDGLFSGSEIDEIGDFFEDYKTRGGNVYDNGSSYEEIDPAKRQLRAMHPHRHSNGCLYVAPGSHRRGIFCPDKTGSEPWLDYGESHITPFPRELKPVPVAVPRGSTMFFSGNLVHGSGPNRTRDRSRRAFIGHYIDQASTQVAEFYHPVLAMDGSVARQVEVYKGGGPCGDGWRGGVH